MSFESTPATEANGMHVESFAQLRRRWYTFFR
jgi:hypothetical protein